MRALIPATQLTLIRITAMNAGYHEGIARFALTHESAPVDYIVDAGMSVADLKLRMNYL